MCHYYGAAEDQWFRTAWAKTGKKLDMGKCCVRFKNVDDVPLEVIGEAIRRVPAKKFIALYEQALGSERLALIGKKAESAKHKAQITKKKAPGRKRPSAA